MTEHVVVYTAIADERWFIAAGHLYRSSATPQPSDSCWLVPEPLLDHPGWRKRQRTVDKIKLLARQTA